MGQSLLRSLESMSELQGYDAELNQRMLSLLAGKGWSQDHLTTEAFGAQLLFVGFLVFCFMAGFML